MLVGEYLENERFGEAIPCIKTLQSLEKRPTSFLTHLESFHIISTNAFTKLAIVSSVPVHALSVQFFCQLYLLMRPFLDSQQNICRIPTHLFKLVDTIEALGKKRDPPSTGWGRGLRRVVSDWYNKRADNPMHLAMQVTKYGSRHEWSHRDLFRLSHIKPRNDEVGFIIRYLLKGLKEAETSYLEDGYLSRDQLEKVRCCSFCVARGRSFVTLAYKLASILCWLGVWL